MSKASSDFTFEIKTGDKKHGGTDNEVFIQLYDDGGQESKTVKLSNFFEDNFESGKLDVFDIKDNDFLGRVNKVKIWRQGWMDDDWFVEKMTVRRKSDFSVFPVHRWIPRDNPLIIEELDSSLPQNSNQTKARKAELKRFAFSYELDKKTNLRCPFVTLKNLPEDQSFASDYAGQLKKEMLNLGLSNVSMKAFKSGTWESLEDLYKIYGGDFYLPKGATDWQSDTTYGNVFLTGPNPKMIRLCEEIPAKFAIDQKTLESLLEGKTVKECLEAKKLFIIDYEILDDLFANTDEPGKACGSMALFYVNKKDQLVPVAIQLEQTPAEDNPVFYPSDNSNTWLLAKMFFTRADTQYHQSISHLGFTHLLMESYTIATHRNLSISHPVNRLMAPHLVNLLAINFDGLPTLLNPGGWVDGTMDMGGYGMMEIMNRVHEHWRLDVHGTLPNHLKERKVDDPKVLPNYSYRDDGLPIYRALEEYVSTVIKGIYAKEEDLKNDHELQAWAKELVTPYLEGGCELKGVPGNGAYTNTDDLIATLTPLIFLCSAEHAAVNFPQYEYYGFPPCYSCCLSTCRPKTKNPLTEDDILKALPSREKVSGVMLMSKILSTRGTSPLGNFDIQYAFDPMSVEALKKLKQDLKAIETETIARNSTRAEPYDVLLPSTIPNSISI